MNFREKVVFWLASVGISNELSESVLSDRRLALAIKDEDAFDTIKHLKSALFNVAYEASKEAREALETAREQLMLSTYLSNDDAPSPRILPRAQAAETKKKTAADQPAALAASPNVFYTRHDGGVTLMRNGKQSTVSNTHINFQKILDALQEKRFGDLDHLMSLTAAINHQGQATTVELKGRRVFVKNGNVYFNKTDGTEERLHGTLVTRLLEALANPKNQKFADGLLQFLDNIQLNPLKDIRAELYEFLMSGKTPITFDGCFLAYKKVNSNFKDIYTGTMDNSPGKVVRMDPEKVNRNRHETCSNGLHFASRGYLSHYGGSGGTRVVVVKVNPKDVYAIPTDYQYQKGRASEYFVVGEFTGNTSFEDAFLDSFIDDENKTAVAPKIAFHGSSLRPSLEQVAESYLLCADGKVNVIKDESVGIYFVVRQNTDSKNPGWYDVKGRMHPAENVKSMSFETKTVREAVKFAVAELERIVAERLAAQKASEEK